MIKEKPWQSPSDHLNFFLKMPHYHYQSYVDYHVSISRDSVSYLESKWDKQGVTNRSLVGWYSSCRKLQSRGKYLWRGCFNWSHNSHHPYWETNLSNTVGPCVDMSENSQTLQPFSIGSEFSQSYEHRKKAKRIP